MRKSSSKRCRKPNETQLNAPCILRDWRSDRGPSGRRSGPSRCPSVMSRPRIRRSRLGNPPHTPKSNGCCSSWVVIWAWMSGWLAMTAVAKCRGIGLLICPT